jgi:hypothetical protein
MRFPPVMTTPRPVISIRGRDEFQKLPTAQRELQQVLKLIPTPFSSGSSP